MKNMNFIRKNIAFLLVMLVPFMVEQKSLYTFVKWIWVKPIAQHFSDNIWVSILTIAIVGFFYYEGFFKRKSRQLRSKKRAIKKIKDIASLHSGNI